VRNKILVGDALEQLRTLPDGCAHCCVTSPPYWGLRDYGEPGQIGLEETPQEYIDRLVEIFGEVWRVLRDDGTLWLNLGDSYAGNATGSRKETDKSSTNRGCAFDRPDKLPPGLKPKDLVGIPWRVAFALQADGWYLRSDIVWNKPNPMPESVTDRPTKAHEYIFLLSKIPRYYYDADAVREAYNPETLGRYSYDFQGTAPTCRQGDGDISRRLREYGPREPNPSGRNRRTVWTVATEPYPDAHFAVYPTALIKPCILAGCPAGGVVLDPFIGSGTTGLVAVECGRDYLGIELSEKYAEMARRRIAIAQPPLPGMEP
jgi:DNA modification methylase